MLSKHTGLLFVCLHWYLCCFPPSLLNSQVITARSICPLENKNGEYHRSVDWISFHIKEMFCLHTISCSWPYQSRILSVLISPVKNTENIAGINLCTVKAMGTFSTFTLSTPTDLGGSSTGGNLCSVWASPPPPRRKSAGDPGIGVGMQKRNLCPPFSQEGVSTRSVDGVIHPFLLSHLLFGQVTSTRREISFSKINFSKT